MKRIQGKSGVSLNSHEIFKSGGEKGFICYNSEYYNLYSD